MNRKGDEIDHVDQGIRDGLRIKHEHPAKANMGVHGQACTAMISYPIVNEEVVNILPMGRLQEITMDIEGASMLVDFEVIYIVDDNNPYPVLLGID